MKWTGINLLILVVVIAAVTGMRQNLHFDAPYPNIKASADSAIIARGRHLVLAPRIASIVTMRTILIRWRL